MLRDTLIAVLAVGGLVWFIANRIGKFKHWVKDELMGDAKFVEAIGAEVEKRLGVVLKALDDHEEREVRRTAEAEERVERRLVSFGSYLSILEEKLNQVERKLESKPPRNHNRGE